MEYYVGNKTYHSIVDARACAYKYAQYLGKEGRFTPIEVHSNTRVCGSASYTRKKDKIVWHTEFIDGHVRILNKNGTLGRIVL